MKDTENKLAFIKARATAPYKRGTDKGRRERASKYG